jgi:hypothetical protein
VEGGGGPVADGEVLGNVERIWEIVGGSVKAGEALWKVGEAQWKGVRPCGRW